MSDQSSTPAPQDPPDEAAGQQEAHQADTQAAASAAVLPPAPVLAPKQRWQDRVLRLPVVIGIGAVALLIGALGGATANALTHHQRDLRGEFGHHGPMMNGHRGGGFGPGWGNGGPSWGDRGPGNGWQGGDGWQGGRGGQRPSFPNGASGGSDSNEGDANRPDTNRSGGSTSSGPSRNG